MNPDGMSSERTTGQGMRTDGTGDGRTSVAPIAPVAVQDGRVLRAVEASAGLLGGGLALGGIVLLLVQLLGPVVIDEAVGPGWGVVAAHLLIGAAAESARSVRRRLSVPVRALVATLTVLAVLTVLLLSWWR